MNYPARWTRDEDRLRFALGELAAMEGRSGEPLAGGPDHDGQTLIVNTTTTDGMHTVVRMAVPLAEDDAAAVRSSVRALLDLLGHKRGSARTEVVLTPSGPLILDCWVLTIGA